MNSKYKELLLDTLFTVKEVITVKSYGMERCHTIISKDATFELYGDADLNYYLKVAGFNNSVTPSLDNFYQLSHMLIPKIYKIMDEGFIPPNQTHLFIGTLYRPEIYKEIFDTGVGKIYYMDTLDIYRNIFTWDDYLLVRSKDYSDSVEDLKKYFNDDYISDLVKRFY